MSNNAIERLAHRYADALRLQLEAKMSPKGRDPNIYSFYITVTEQDPSDRSRVPGYTTQVMYGPKDRDYTIALEGVFRSWLGFHIRWKHPDWKYDLFPPEEWSYAAMADALEYQVRGHFR